MLGAKTVLVKIGEHTILRSQTQENRETETV